MLFTSSRMPQSARSTTSVRNSHSVICEAGERRVGTDILDGYWNFEVVLHLADALDGARNGFPGVRQRQQVVGVRAVDRAPAKMIAEPRSAGATHKSLEPLQVFGIGCGHRAEVHRNAMLHDAIALEDLIEHGQRSAAIDHEVFRDDFKPVHHRLARKDVLVVRNAQTDSDAVVLECIEAIASHEERSQFKFTVAVSESGVSVKAQFLRQQPPK